MRNDEHMSDAVGVLLPFTSVLLGAGITYLFSVRTRRRSKIEDVYHDAIAAVAVAHAAHDFIQELAPWRGSTPEEAREVSSLLAREGNLNYARSVADARAALARASAYDPRLSVYFNSREDIGSNTVYLKADEIMQHLRQNIEDGT